MRQLTAMALVATTLVFASIARGQALNEAFLKSAVLVTFSTAQGNRSAGTGFFIFRPVKGDQGHVLLITNKHVLPPQGTPQAVEIRVVVGTGNAAKVGKVEVPIVGPDGKYLPSVRMHPDPSFDVAGVNVTEAVVKQGLQGTWLPLDLLSTPERLTKENITIGDEIFLLGYPDAIFDARNVSPILRTGVIASVPSEGYAFNETTRKRFSLPTRIDGFLIDANVFPGSSGSVVILKQQPTTIGPDGGTVISRAKKIPYILGIVSGSLPITDTALGSTQRMGLGVVYSAEAIRAVVDEFPK